MSEQIVQFLSGLKPFSFLPEDEIRKMADEITEKNYEEDTILSVQGKSEIEEVYVVKSGLLELYYEVDGKKIHPGSIKPGEVCGAMAMLMNEALAVRTVRVAQDASLYLIPKEIFLDIVARFRPFNDFFVRIYNKLVLDESYASLIATGQAFQFLSGVVPFSFLPEEKIERVASKLSVVHYPKDTVLLVQGQSPVEQIYIIQKGAVERYYEERSGKKKLRGLLGEGDIYGGISMLINNGISVRSLKTTEKTYFYVLSKENFLNVCDHHETFSEYFTDSFGKRMVDKTYSSIITKTVQSADESLQFFSQPISSVCNNDLLFCDMDTSIQEAASVMSERSCSSIFVRDAEGDFVGIVTDKDLRKRVISKGYDIRKLVFGIMSSPLRTIPAQGLVFEGMMSMMQQNVKHLGVTDPDDKVIGAVTSSDLLNTQGQSPFFLLREITLAENKEDVMTKHAKLPPIIKNLIYSGAKAKNVNTLVTTISDAILHKLIGFALDELGEPPARFIFMILGSEGRREQTLKTDQDNAIIFEDVPDSSEKEVRAYFTEFGEKVCNWLDQAGYAFCEGGIMAKNPKWCQPLSVWKEYFSSWILAAEAEDLLQASIFFDFKGAYGDISLIDDLRGYLFGSIGSWSGFLRHLTENALYFRPPIGFFRNFVVESKGEHRNKFDIKSAMMPIVDSARIYALQNKIEETNTLERLEQLHARKVLSWKDYGDLRQAYDFLMQLRFVRQVKAVIEEDAKPDNYINPKKLSRLEQTMLKEIFKKIEKFQTKLGFDFTGIM
ncbi:putative nucleotidyltransferase substrate binding domain-containing protein [Desulfococcaceae bacterium HSG8]|nr:putative nucleotidyltransferase substrate binding domain-containing protein [Desulfococcaceae bacterium HSG8]